MTCPRAQQTPAPRGAKVPSAHALQRELPVLNSLYVPALHATHTLLLYALAPGVFKKVPTGHAEHALLR